MSKAPVVGDGPRADEPLALLAALVVKTGVHLGGLSDAQRAWALGVAARSLPLGEGVTEAQANVALKSCLMAEAAFLDTDHVELRRWLVDSGWWTRDGFGRCYQRVPEAALREQLRAVAAALDRVELPGWVAARRATVQAQRERRRQAWAGRETPDSAGPASSGTLG